MGRGGEDACVVDGGEVRATRVAAAELQARGIDPRDKDAIEPS